MDEVVGTESCIFCQVYQHHRCMEAISDVFEDSDLLWLCPCAHYGHDILKLEEVLDKHLGPC